MLLLTIEYDLSELGLHTELFVKFSRDLEDPARDRGRYEMEAEVRFAPLSRSPEFPIKVPAVYFADYHRESGTGILISEKIAFGVDGVEPQRQKCLDHEVTNPLEYYQAIIAALARLAAAQNSGRMSTEIETLFPFDPSAAAAADPIPYDRRRLRDLILRYAEFASSYPRLLPDSLCPDFFNQLQCEAGPFLEHEMTIKHFLQSNPEFIALCHWNANIDNAWFWRDEANVMHCGLMDWGRVRQMNVAYALWGCLSAASLEIWDRHLDELLTLFIEELESHGGPRLELSELKLHIDLYVALMGLAWLMEAPTKVLARFPDAATAASRAILFSGSMNQPETNCMSQQPTFTYGAHMTSVRVWIGC